MNGCFILVCCSLAVYIHDLTHMSEPRTLSPAPQSLISRPMSRHLTEYMSNLNESAALRDRLLPSLVIKYIITFNRHSVKSSEILKYWTKIPKRLTINKSSSFKRIDVY